jgi:diguanylate cyclase (GGDEF)-like protein
MRDQLKWIPVKRSIRHQHTSDDGGLSVLNWSFKAARDLMRAASFWVTATAVLCLLLLIPVSRAETLIDLAPGTQVVDLSVHGATVETDRSKIAVELPENRYMQKTVLDLDATGRGPKYTWTVYSIHNASDARREFVIAIDAQRLSASHLFFMKPFGRRSLSVVSTLGKDQFVSRSTSAQDIYALELGPDAAMTFAVEGGAPMAGIRIYDDAAFSKRETAVAFLRGAALTVTLLIALFIVGLYSVRSHSAFVVGGLLAFSCLQFLALESGFLDRFGQGFLNLSFDLQQLRAWSESLLAASLALAAWGLTAPNASPGRSRWWAAAIVLVFCGLAVLGWYYPDGAAALARFIVVGAASLGFVLALRGKQNAAGALSMGMTLWSAIVAWVFFAAIAALGPYEAPVFHAGLLAGLATVVAILSIALARLALAQGYLYLVGSASRSLALAGGRHVLWDWRPNSNQLLLGSELAESLGHDPAHFQGPDAARLFMAHLHPADQITYQRATTLQALAPGQVIDADLRVQDAHGQYHWFALRAAAIPGASNWPERAVGTLTDITEKKETEGRLLTETVRDPVTGLASRAIFNDRLERELGKTLGLPVKVLLVGLSRFKALNEGFGHDLGDQMLMAAGQRISECLLADETLARVSGSVFAVMFVESIGKRGAETLASEIIGRLAEPLSVAGQDVHLTACIGISKAGAPGTSASALQDQAANALGAAQSRGLSEAVVYDESMTNLMATEVAMELDLRKALARGEIEVHYQHIVHFASRTIVGFEALARWHHAERGFLPTGDFIAVAEQSGLVGEVSAKVLADATRQLGIWQRTLARNRRLFVAVNISGEQLSDASLFDRISAAIDREALAPESLTVEITESVAMRFPERARRLIAKLKAAGVSVACDDFGTGYSNLASLRDLQFDTLKMDRSFIAEGGLEDRGGTILGAVISLAHQLGMEVVAEGVEDEQQALFLEAIGVDMAQGYWLGEPRPAIEIPGLLAVLPAVAQPETTVAAIAAPPPGQARKAPRTLEWSLESAAVPAREAMRRIAIIAEDEEVEPTGIPKAEATPPKDKARKKPMRVKTAKPTTTKKKPKSRPRKTRQA